MRAPWSVFVTKVTRPNAVIEAKSGHVDFDMSWTGAPGAGSMAAATGHVKVALDKGQIAGLKPGAGRLFGLASVAELPRRLALDFSDLTDKGFAFDTVHGDFDLHDGVNQVLEDVVRWAKPISPLPAPPSISPAGREKTKQIGGRPA